MKAQLSWKWFFFLLIFLNIPNAAKAADRKVLSAEEQKKFLAQRTPMKPLGSFDGFCSLLYAANNVAIHTESREINHTKLSSPFPNFYQPTWAELFDSIGRQTKSTWKYDPKRDYWVFAKSAPQLPYQIKKAPDWKAMDRGTYVSYIPPVAPVGMDVYMMGTFSSKKDPKTLFAKVRESIALAFAKNFDKNITAADMGKKKIGPAEALFYKVTAPQTGIIWRQWVFVDDSGQAFAIVSAIKSAQEKELLPDVEAMLKSFGCNRSSAKQRATSLSF